jgi:hypothetical protein
MERARLYVYFNTTSISNIFENWVHDIDYKYIILPRVGAVALIWSLSLYRNDKKNYNKNSSLLQVIYIQMYEHSLSMVTASPHGGPRPLFGGGVHV